MKSLTALLAASVVALSAASVSSAATYTIDPGHSSVSFKVKHLGISNVVGTFEKFDGTFDYDPATNKASAANATIEVTSVSTKDEKRDGHLKSPDFFDAEKYPTISFQTTSVSPIKKNGAFTVNGDLTIRGITKPVTLQGTFNGAAADPWGGERASFTATTTINRLDYGVSWNKTMDKGGLLVGKDVILTIEAEGVQNKDKAAK